MSTIRGIRGAITVSKNTKEDIISSTSELLRQMVQMNGVRPDDIASIIFSMTKDLNAEFPATAARDMGWKDVPLLCTNEIEVKGGLKKCIRVLMHVNSDKGQPQMKHVYLKEAKSLRPDLG